MKNKTVKLVLAIILLGVLTGGYFGVKSYVASQEEEEEEQEEEKTSVFEAKTDDIKSLKFLIDEKEVTFLKEDDGTWVNKDEKDFPVDQDTLNNAASYISSIDADRVLENVEDLSEYGLDSPQNTITVSLEGEDDGDDEEKTAILRVGMENDSTSQYYIGKDDDKSTVYVVGNSVISPFMNNLYDYAESQDFPAIDASTVSAVNVDQKENSYMAEKNEDTTLWSISYDDKSEKADTSKMNSLTSSLASMEYDSFVDYNCTNEKEYGLDDPYAVVTIDYEEEAEEVEEDGETKVDEESEKTEESEKIDDSEKSKDTADAEESAEIESDDSSDGQDGSDILDDNTLEDNSLDDTLEDTTDIGTEEEDSEPVMIKKELILKVGKEADSDSRYVMLDGSNEVYTMTNDILSTVVDKDVSTMLDMTVNYLSVNDLDSLDINIDGKNNTINVSRETLVVEDEDTKDDESSEDAETTGEEDSEPETETVVAYLLNGEKLDDISFTTFYNKLINMSGQKRLTEEYNPETDPEMTVVFHSLDNESVNVDFYPYDTNYYAAVVDNERVYLLNKMNYKELRSSYDELIVTVEEENKEDNKEDTKDYIRSDENSDVDNDTNTDTNDGTNTVENQE